MSSALHQASRISKSPSQSISPELYLLIVILVGVHLAALFIWIALWIVQGRKATRTSTEKQE
jgi:hypothetical protein